MVGLVDSRWARRFGYAGPAPTEFLAARAARLKVIEVRESRDADCGHELLKSISEPYSAACEEFNRAWAALRLKDPSAPEGDVL